jgi:hypothetical protein
MVIRGHGGKTARCPLYLSLPQIKSVRIDGDDELVDEAKKRAAKLGLPPPSEVLN